MDTRDEPVFMSLILALDDGDVDDPVPFVAPGFISAHPMAKVARPIEAQRNILENGFIWLDPSSMDKQVEEYTEECAKKQDGEVTILFPIPPGV